MPEDRLIVSISGVRGTVGATLTPQIACDFGCAFGTRIRRRKGGCVKVAIARDARPSGPMVQGAVAAGLSASGADVIDLGVVTTPGAALMTRRLEADGGVVITASHNPSPYNGIKFLQPSGVGLTADDAKALKETWLAKDFDLSAADDVGKYSQQKKTHSYHLEAVCAICDVTGISSKRFKVVLDSINGAGCVVTPTLLGMLGCEVVHLNGEATGRFAHTPEPIAENLTGLCEAVRKHAAAVGFAQDPDADRLVIVDENGRFIGEEYTLVLAASQVLRHRKGKLATNLSTSRMIDELASAAGCEVVRAPTGEANVVQAMQQEECIFGGEGNGGVIEPRVVSVRDSLVGIAYVLQAMAETGKTVSELAGELPRYSMVKTKFPCPPEAAPRIIELVRTALESHEGTRLDERDGLRADLPDGWVNVRASNTEPIMRIMAEARDQAAADALVDEVRAIADAVIAR